MKDSFRKYLILICFFLLEGIVIPRDAFSLPTPDSIVIAFQIVPVITSAIIGVLAAAGIYLKRHLDKLENPVGSLLKICIFLFCCLIISILVTTYYILQENTSERIANIAMYLRSDNALDTLELDGRAKKDLWYSSGAIKRLGFDELEKFEDYPSKPVLIDLDSMRLKHDSGFPGFIYKGELIGFEFLYHAELYEYLNQLITNDKNALKRPLIFHKWDRFSIIRPIDRNEKIAALLKRFDYVYALPFIFDVGELQLKKTIAKACIKHLDTGLLEETNLIHGLIKFPVRNEGIYNEEIIYFPNVFSLVSAKKFIDVVKNPDVKIIAPYNSLYRSKMTHEYYLNRYLKDVTPERLLLIDFNSQQISKEVERIAFNLKDKKFVTIGLTKQDWIYMGLDIAYKVWLTSGRQAPGAYGYLGSTTQIAEVASILTNAEGNFTSRGFKKIRKIFKKVLTLSSDKMDVSIGFSILCLAMVFRLLLFPISYLESKSRFIRNDLKQFIKIKLKKYPDFYFMTGYEDYIAKFLGCNKAIEVAGGLISFMIILPFYPVITNIEFPTEAILSFLWVEDILKPSSSLALILIFVISIKLVVPRIGYFPKRLQGTDSLILISLVLFQVLLSKIPATILIFAIGVLGIQTLFEITARIITLKVVGNNMLLENKKKYSIFKGEANERDSVLTLQNSILRNNIGNKGTRLGVLIGVKSDLFIVPKGVVLTPDALRESIESEASFKKYVWKEIKRNMPEIDKNRVAVRSCGLSEDSNQFSHAGQYKTHLNVGLKDLHSAIVDVTKSFHGQDQDKSSIIIQQMADVDIAGVLFTSAPENPHISLVEYNPGIADDLVSGKTIPIEVSIGKWSGTIKENISNKEETIFNNKIKTNLYKRLFLVGRLVEEKFGNPQDIEWGYSFKKDMLYIIQSRDITAFVYKDKIESEQSRLLLKTTRNLIQSNEKVIWELGDVIEVVDQPSPFTISLLSELYSNSGSQGIAMRNMGFLVSENNKSLIDSIFGVIYNNRIIIKNNSKLSLGNLRASMLMRKRIIKNPHKNFINPMNQKLNELASNNCDIAGMSEDLYSPQKIFKAILNKLNFFLEKYSALAYEANVVTGLANKYLIEKSQEEYKNGTSLPPTRTTELFSDLSKLCQNKEIESFVQKWGHRSISDYDLATPSFVENKAQTLKYAQNFTSFNKSILNPGASEDFLNSSFDNKATTYHQFIMLKEKAKDESLKYLRSIRPLFIQLSKILRISLDDVFNIYLPEIRTLTLKYSEKDFTKLLDKSKERNLALKEQREIAFKEKIALENIEFISDDDFLSDTIIGSKITTRESKDKGLMVSKQKYFKGKVRFVFTKEDYKKDFSNDDILVVKHLSPDLVPLFSKVAGCISEKGGRLSHAAIVAREMNFPILVSTILIQSEIQEGKFISVTKEGKVNLKISTFPEKNYI
jgi:phosphohistidine swiveling domain-containing protein